MTLAFLPYAHNLKQQTAKARAAGHELLVHLPMEPMGKADPGPDALLTSLDTREIKARLTRNLSHFGAFVGVNNHMGSAATSDPAMMETVLSELKRRGLLFVDSRTSPRSVAGDMARKMGVPTVERDVFLDHRIDRQAIEAALAKLERIARETGIAIGIGPSAPGDPVGAGKVAARRPRRGESFWCRSARLRRKKKQDWCSGDRDCGQGFALCACVTR